MADDSQDVIDAAIQKAESLFASLLVRPSATANEVDGEVLLSPTHHVITSPVDASLATVGVATSDPAPLTAQSQVAEPAFLDGVSPRDSLSVLVSRASESSLVTPSNYDTVYRMMKEREKDLEIAAKIGQSLLERNDLLEKDLSSVSDQRTSLEQQVAQLRYNMSRKEELLRLYATDAKEREGQRDSPEGDGVNPEWVRILTEECRELRESNMELRTEAEKLKTETAEVEGKEKELVQQCLEQFTEAKRRLAALRIEAESKAEENAVLQERLTELTLSYEEEAARYQQLAEEHDSLKEQLIEAQYTGTHLTNELSDLKERFDENSVLLKEKGDELQAYKESSMQNSMSGEGGSEGQQESIVREIEEALRKEIIAASTLPERPRSPNHYAQQRTRIVMETVRAATMATAKRLEKLAAEAAKSKADNPPVKDKPSNLLPLAASSPQQQTRNTRTTGAQWGVPPSPVCSEASSTVSMPEEFIRYRNQLYVGPEKLQIVKPLEGSVTLLKWKLMATPQLGGATTFFSDASRPGVHLKGWKAAGIVDEKGASAAHSGHNLTADVRQKSLSTADLSRMNTTYPPGPSVRRRMSKKGAKPSTAPGIARTSARPKQVEKDASPSKGEDSSTLEEKSSEKSSSLLQHVGSFFGSGLSRLGLSRRSHDPSNNSSSSANTSKVEPPSVEATDHDLGLAGIL